MHWVFKSISDLKAYSHARLVQTHTRIIGSNSSSESSDSRVGLVLGGLASFNRSEATCSVAELMGLFFSSPKSYISFILKKNSQNLIRNPPYSYFFQF